MENIVLFGGTFDPIHNGHIQAINFIKKFFKNCVIYIIPVKKHRWKKPFSSTKHRLKMIKLATENMKFVRISHYEIKSKKNPNYTIDTINYFTKKFPKKKIFFLIGSDIINEFPFWKKSDEILKKITLICLKRPGQKYSIPSNYKKNIKFFKYNTTIKMSSDMVRNLQKLDLPEKVLEYITKKRLYFIKKVKKYYTAKRLKHALNVALLAMKIAKKNKIKNYKKCYIAGLLHDITKKMPLKQQREIIYKIDKKNINIHKNLYHQLTGAYIVKKDFNINDKVIIDAIKFHTTGKKNFSPVGKILFIADKLDPSRNIKNLKIMLNNSYKNYNNIYLSLLKKISKLNF